MSDVKLVDIQGIKRVNIRSLKLKGSKQRVKPGILEACIKINLT